MEGKITISHSLFDACKKVFSLALPMAGTQLVNVASGFLCMAMLAALGHDVLAASALIFSTQLAIMVTGMSILFSLSVLIGHAFGAKDYGAIGIFVQQGWTLALVMSIPMMLFFWHVDSIMLLFGQSQKMTQIIQNYFHAFVWAVIPGLLSTCNMQFGYGIHKKLLIVFTSILSVIVLLVIAYVLIFGKFGFPQMGVAGLGYATIAQYSSFFIFTTFFFYFEKSFKPYELFKYRVHQHLNYFKKMLKIGGPICIQMGGELLSLFISGIMIGWLGTTALAAFQIVNQYYMLIIIPIFSISQASSILVGHACGAKQFHEVKKLSYASIGIVLAISLIVTVIFFTIPKHLAAFYMNVNDPANVVTLHLTMLIFLIIAFSQFFDAIKNILTGLLRGLFDTRIPMHLSLLTIWIIGMPLSYILAFSLSFGAVGFVVGGMVGMMAAAAAMSYRWYRINKQY